MVGPTTVSIEELELEDQVKVVGNDGSFEAVIKDASPEEGITFKRLSDGGFFVIAFEDFIDYDLYPKGETIRKIADRKRAIQEAENSFAQKEQLLEKNHSSGIDSFRNAFPLGKCYKVAKRGFSALIFLS